MSDNDQAAGASQSRDGELWADEFCQLHAQSGEHGVRCGGSIVEQDGQRICSTCYARHGMTPRAMRLHVSRWNQELERTGRALVEDVVRAYRIARERQESGEALLDQSEEETARNVAKLLVVPWAKELARSVWAGSGGADSQVLGADMRALFESEGCPRCGGTVQPWLGHSQCARCGWLFGLMALGGCAG